MKVRLEITIVPGLFRNPIFRTLVIERLMESLTDFEANIGGFVVLNGFKIIEDECSHWMNLGRNSP